MPGELLPCGAKALGLKLLNRLDDGTLLSSLAEQVFKFVPYAPMFNATGQSALSVSLHWNEADLPIGVRFVGRCAGEATLLRLGGQLERAQASFQPVTPMNGGATNISEARQRWQTIT